MKLTNKELGKVFGEVNNEEYVERCKNNGFKVQNRDSKKKYYEYKMSNLKK